jgi:hypothetical protein
MSGARNSYRLRFLARQLGFAGLGRKPGGVFLSIERAFYFTKPKISNFDPAYFNYGGRPGNIS